MVDSYGTDGMVEWIYVDFSGKNGEFLRIYQGKNQRGWRFIVSGVEHQKEDWTEHHRKMDEFTLRNNGLRLAELIK